MIRCAGNYSIFEFIRSKYMRFTILILMGMVALSGCLTTNWPGIPKEPTLTNGFESDEAHLPTQEPILESPSPVFTIEPVRDYIFTLELIGQIGGDSSAIALVGDYAFLGVGPRIYILDISLPQHPKFISSSPVAGRGTVIAIQVIGTNVYAITGEADFLIVTYDEQYNFTTIASIELPEKVFDFILNGDFAYLAAGKAGILVLDIQNPTDPSILQFINTRGEARAVAVSGGYLYVAEAVQYSGATGGVLEVFDLSEPAAPHKVGSADVETPSLAITVQEDYAYLACGGVCLVNVSNPHQPNPTGRFTDYSLYDDIVVVGEYAFVSTNLYCDITSCPKRLARIDIQDPQNPIYIDPLMDVSDWRGFGSGRGLVAKDELIYLASGTGLQILDGKDMELIGEFQHIGSTADFVIGERYLYVTDYERTFSVVDISDAAFPVVVGMLNDCELCRNLVYQRGNVFTNRWRGNEILVIDVKDPLDPQVITRLNFEDGFVISHLVDRSYLYVIRSRENFPISPAHSELEIFDINNIAFPEKIGSLLLSMDVHYDWRLFPIGNYLYISTEGQLNIYDVSNINEPLLVGEINIDPGMKSDYWSTEVVENYAIMASRGQGSSLSTEMTLIDLSEPAQPHIISTLPISSGGSHITIASEIVYLSGFDGISVVDISKTFNPNEVDVLALNGKKIHALEDFLYVNVESGGIWILTIRRD
jgi:hypothetical protein